MIKKVILIVSIVINIILADAFLIITVNAVNELNFAYVEEETIRPDSLRKYLEWENYGTAACLARPVRAGAEIDEEYADYYRLGEYTDLLFLKELFDRAGNTDTVSKCENRIEEIREEMPEYATIFDKMDQSAKDAVKG